MGNLEKAFGLLAKGTLIRAAVDAKIEGYTKGQDVIIQKLWNNKFAIYKDGHGGSGTNYKTFETEDSFLDTVKIMTVKITNQLNNGIVPILTN